MTSDSTTYQYFFIALVIKHIPFVGMNWNIEALHIYMIFYGLLIL